jgi:hypothetical protein
MVAPSIRARANLTHLRTGSLAGVTPRLSDSLPFITVKVARSALQIPLALGEGHI